MTSNNGDLERVLRENLKLRRQVVAEFTKASEPISFGHTNGGALGSEGPRINRSSSLSYSC